MNDTLESPRLLPHNLEAEKSLLGALLTDNRAFERVSDFLLPEHFTIPEHARIFEAYTTIVNRGQTANPVSLSGFFENDEQLIAIGGPAYLAELAASAITIINAGEYGRIIYDLHLKRELIYLGEDMVNGAFDPDVEITATDQIENAERHLSELAGDSVGETQTRGKIIMDLLSELEDRKNNPGRLLGLPTGLTALDKILRGLRDTDLVIVAARPSMGKTALAGKIAHHAANLNQQTDGEEGTPVLFFSLEMGAGQVASRLISANANVPADFMEMGEYHDDSQFQNVVDAGQKLITLPLFIDERAGLTVSAMKSHARRMKRKWAIGLIIVDYLQIISTPRGRNDGRVNDVSAMTRELKIMAKELGVPVVALSQLSRAVEQRDPPRPRLSDLRDSGSIEQDADVVMFLYREEYYLERKEPSQREDEDELKYLERQIKWQDRMTAVRNQADIDIAKNRKGRTGSCKVIFRGPCTTFDNMAPEYES